MRRVRLYLQSNELVGLEYFCGGDAPARYSVRGKTAGAFKGAGSFQWTTAVRALSLSFLSAIENPLGIHLSGHAGSLAASLDYALSKQPIWLAEMFGVDTLGNCVARRFTYRTNSERKRPGPVSLSLNHSYLESAMIEVVVDGRQLVDVQEIAALRMAIMAEGGEGGLDVPLAA
jgi:hypothetical protein